MKQSGKRRWASRLAARLMIMLIAVPAFATGANAGGRGASFEPDAQKRSTSRARKSGKPAAKTPAATTPAKTTPAKTEPAKTQQAQTTAGGNRVAIIETNLGTIKVELLENEAPKTAENFRLLVERGYYNGLTFHRVISGFMIQGGDPNGNGTGGETASGQPLPNEEANGASPLYAGGYKRGIVAMANKGRPDTAGSQFFIMHRDYPLPPNYTIFGRVIEGIEVVDKIASVHTGRMDRPIEPVVMKKVTLQ